MSSSQFCSVLPSVIHPCTVRDKVTLLGGTQPQHLLKSGMSVCRRNTWFPLICFKQAVNVSMTVTAAQGELHVPDCSGDEEEKWQGNEEALGVNFYRTWPGKNHLWNTVNELISPTYYTVQCQQWPQRSTLPGLILIMGTAREDLQPFFCTARPWYRYLLWLIPLYAHSTKFDRRN